MDLEFLEIMAIVTKEWIEKQFDQYHSKDSCACFIMPRDIICNFFTKSANNLYKTTSNSIHHDRHNRSNG